MTQRLFLSKMSARMAKQQNHVFRQGGNSHLLSLTTSFHTHNKTNAIIYCNSEKGHSILENAMKKISSTTEEGVDYDEIRECVSGELSSLNSGK